MKNQRGRGAEYQRSDHREQREVERVHDRLEEALIGRQLDVVLESDKVRDRADSPVERAHPDGEEPGKNDDRADDDERRHGEEVI